MAGGRSTADLRLKWRKLHSDVKQKAAKIKNSRRTTGGGPPTPELTETETKILSCIPDELIVGIPGAVDSSENIPPETSVVPLLSSRVSNETFSTPSGISTPKKHYPPSPVKVPSKKRLDNAGNEDQFLELERERLQVERERLALENERLLIDRERLSVEKEILLCLKKFSDKPSPETSYVDMLFK